MRSRIVHAWIVGCCAFVACGRADSAQFTSTRAFTEPNKGWISVHTQNPHAGWPSLQRSYFSAVSASAQSATLVVDDVVDRGAVVDLQVTPLSMSPGTYGRRFSVDVEVVEEPANFPLPEVRRHVQGEYEERITLLGFTSPPAVFQSSSTDRIRDSVPPYFRMDNHLTFSASPFVVEGTYEAIGPVSRVSVPFSVKFEPAKFPLRAELLITGGSNFGDDFDFDVKILRMFYFAANPVIFNGTVDGLEFRASLGMTPVILRGVPEPSSLLLMGSAALGMVAFRRRSQ